MSVMNIRSLFTSSGCFNLKAALIKLILAVRSHTAVRFKTFGSDEINISIL